MKNIQHLHKFSRSHSLISPSHAQELMALATADADRGLESTASTMQQCAAIYGAETDRKPFPFAGGIAVIPVYGALLHRDGWCSSYATGYDYIASRFAAALGDPEVKGILWDINSYGGHVAGNFELCDAIYAARGQKPMMAVVDSRAFSGGYSIASSVGRIIAAPSAEAGSVGVVMMHMSIEEALKQMGVEITFIYAGAHKVDGNPFKDLPDDVKAALQASVEKSYNQFVSLVARNRGIEADAVRNTEARIYDADDAKEVGLIDDVMAPRDAFAAFLSEVNASSQTKGKKNMANQNASGNAAGGEGEEAITPPTGNASTPNVDDARKAERERVNSILACDEAKSRKGLAHHLAMSTDMSVDAAKATLAAAPEEKQAAVNPLDAAMSGTDNPNVGNDGGGDAGGEPQMTAGQRISKTHAKLSGRNK
jgi:signal peptide peptidase SppA